MSEQQEIQQIYTAVININPGLDLSVMDLSSQVQSLLRYAESRTVTGDADVMLATDDLKMMASLKKALDSKKKEYSEPLKTYLKTITDAFETILLPLGTADRITREKILAYRAEQERKRREAEEINRLREEAARREMELKGELTQPLEIVETPAPVAKVVHAEAATLGTVKTTRFEVIDFKALPDDYKIADMVKIGKVAKAGVAIPGVRTWTEESLRVR